MAHRLWDETAKGENIMPKYVTLFNFTEKGAQAIKDMPEATERAIKNFEAVGGKVLGLYLVMGAYDMVGVFECPSDEVASTSLLSLASAGLVRTTTLKAFTKDEFYGIVKNIPT